jgi:ADP-ribose pyrophosphatase
MVSYQPPRLSANNAPFLQCGSVLAGQFLIFKAQGRAAEQYGASAGELKWGRWELDHKSPPFYYALLVFSVSSVVNLEPRTRRRRTKTYQLRPFAVFSMSNNQRTLYESRRFAVVETTITRPDGEPASCQFIKHPGSVAILPVVDEGHVCLIRSRRLTVDKVLIEVPAGTREPLESPLETARRELAEETGYRAAQFHELTSFYPSPGISNERMWIYVARELTAGEPAREANEEIDNLIVSWNEALAMIDRGEIEDGKTIVAILQWQQSRIAASNR